MSFTYAQLKQAIEDYAEYSETSFVANIPLFIRLAEERILKNVQLNLFQKNQQGSMTTGNQYLACPGDFLAPFSLSITSSGDKSFLLFKDMDFVQTYNPDSSVTGTPLYYAQFDVNTFIIGPTPDADYVVDIHYLYRPASITAGAEDGTTWLSENAEMALLFGSLVEAYLYMKGEAQLMATYDARFTEAVARLKNLGEGQETVDEYRRGPLARGRT
jgi:hypothetical protein